MPSTRSASDSWKGLRWSSSSACCSTCSWLCSSWASQCSTSTASLTISMLTSCVRSGTGRDDPEPAPDSGRGRRAGVLRAASRPAPRAAGPRRGGPRRHDGGDVRCRARAGVGRLARAGRPRSIVPDHHQRAVPRRCPVRRRLSARGGARRTEGRGRGFPVRQCARSDLHGLPAAFPGRDDARHREPGIRAPLGGGGGHHAGERALIYFHRHHRSLEATWKYLLICSVGIALALLGIFLLAVAATSLGTYAVSLVL